MNKLTLSLAAVLVLAGGAPSPAQPFLPDRDARNSRRGSTLPRIAPTTSRNIPARTSKPVIVENTTPGRSTSIRSGGFAPRPPIGTVVTDLPARPVVQPRPARPGDLPVPGRGERFDRPYRRDRYRDYYAGFPIHSNTYYYNPYYDPTYGYYASSYYGPYYDAYSATYQPYYGGYYPPPVSGAVGVMAGGYAPVYATQAVPSTTYVQPTRYVPTATYSTTRKRTATAPRQEKTPVYYERTLEK